jgi:hypothetical protein
VYFLDGVLVFGILYQEGVQKPTFSISHVYIKSRSLTFAKIDMGDKGPHLRW